MGNEVIFVRCAGCGAPACTVYCEDKAIAYVSGDLLIDLTPCAACPAYAPADGGGLTMPPCVAACNKSETKTIVSPLNLTRKRERAANTLLL